MKKKKIIICSAGILIIAIIFIILMVQVIIPANNRDKFQAFFETSTAKILEEYGMSLEYVEYGDLNTNYNEYYIDLYFDSNDADYETIFNALIEINLFGCDYGIDDDYKLVEDDVIYNDSKYNGYNFYIMKYFQGDDCYEASCASDPSKLEINGEIAWQEYTETLHGNISNEETFDDLRGTGFNNTRPNSPAESNEIKAHLMKCIECGNHTDNGVNSRCDYCRERAKKTGQDDWL